MTTVTTEYLQGVRDGREALKLGAEPATELAFCERVKGWAYSGLHADYIAGLRDFWENQAKKTK